MRQRPNPPHYRRVESRWTAGGRGWQTRIDHALRDWIKQHDIA